jgi:histidinol-phosphatase (PHP family)
MSIIQYDYHIHTNFCDGTTEAENFVKKAIDKDMQIIGFSSHAPVPFETDWTMKENDLPEYLQTIRNLKKKYSGFIKILLGLEVDYIPGIFSVKSSIIKNAGLDYTVGSVHFLGQMEDGFRWTVDGPYDELNNGVNYTFNGNIKVAITAYYNRITEMVQKAPPDIIGHFDLIKKNNTGNCFFSEDEKWYRDLVDRTLNAVAGSGCVLEVNTGGITRKKITSLYPSSWILKKCFDKNIPLVINSDSHSPEHLKGSFEKAVDKIKETGYIKAVYFTENRREEYYL